MHFKKNKFNKTNIIEVPLLCVLPVFFAGFATGFGNLIVAFYTVRAHSKSVKGSNLLHGNKDMWMRVGNRNLQS
jgi:hypothetical protein